MTLTAPRSTGLGRGIGYGLVAALAGAAAWAVLTAVTNYKLGLVALGIGLLVGYAMARSGSTDSRLPFAGAVVALLEDPRFFGDVYKAGFRGMDVLFYAIAAYEGFKFSLLGVERSKAALTPPPAYSPPAESSPSAGGWSSPAAAADLDDSEPKQA